MAARAQAGAETTTQTVATEYIFRWSADSDPAAVAALRAQLQATVLETTPGWGFELWRCDADLDAAALAALRGRRRGWRSGPVAELLAAQCRDHRRSGRRVLG